MRCGFSATRFAICPSAPSIACTASRSICDVYDLSKGTLICSFTRDGVPLGALGNRFVLVDARKVSLCDPAETERYCPRVIIARLHHNSFHGMGVCPDGRTFVTITSSPELLGVPNAVEQTFRGGSVQVWRDSACVAIYSGSWRALSDRYQDRVPIVFVGDRIVIPTDNSCELLVIE